MVYIGYVCGCVCFLLFCECRLDGGYLFTGESASFSSGNFDVYMIRTDSNGDTLWTKTLNGLDNNEGYSLMPTDDNGFAISGTYFNQYGNNDVLFIKGDSTGWIGCTESSTPTTVTNPSTQTVNNHFNYLASSPSVISHSLNETSGTIVEVLCDHVGVSETKIDNSLIISPNPVRNMITIGSLQFASASISIFNILGERVTLPIASRKLSGCQLPTQINLSHLIPGIYFIKVQSGTNSSILKLIKL